MLSSAATALLKRTAAPSVLKRTAAPAVGAVRNLNLHEYQSAKIMSEMGVNVPFGIPAHTVQQAVDAADKIGDEEVVIKSQILAGGRGLGKFKDNDDGTPGLQVCSTPTHFFVGGPHLFISCLRSCLVTNDRLCHRREATSGNAPKPPYRYFLNLSSRK
jgi:hypothetical protein